MWDRIPRTYVFAMDGGSDLRGESYGFRKEISKKNNEVDWILVYPKWTLN